jgi:hypothetical protein
MLIRISQCLDTVPMLTLQIKQDSGWLRLSSELVLVATYSSWIVHRPRIRRIYNNIAVTVESLWVEQCALLCETVLAKRRTVIKRGPPGSMLDGDIC